MNPFEDMQTFVRIVEAGSITKAALQLNTVKSSVSKRLADLEKRLGMTLLHRTTRVQKLTDSGQSYYQQCLRIIEDVQEVESSIRDQHCALSGRIKVAAPLSFGIEHLGKALQQFNQRHPDIQFDIDFNDRKVDIVEEGFDLAIRIAKLADSTLMARKITQTHLILCASPKYLQQHGTPKTPADLLENHLKVRYHTEPDHWHFMVKPQTKTDPKHNPKKSPRIKVAPTTILTANNGQYLCEAVIQGMGLAYIPDFICYQALEKGDLTLVLSDYLVDNQIDCYAIYPPTRHLSARVRALVDYLAQYFGPTPYWALNTTINTTK